MNPIQAAAEEVRRYDIGVAGDMALHPQGDWIRYEDYQSALRRAEAAERESAQMAEDHAALCRELGEAEQARERAEGLLAEVRRRLNGHKWRDQGHHCESRSAVHAAIQMIDAHLIPQRGE